MEMKWNDSQSTTPRWCGDYGDRRTLLSGGAKLDITTFTADGDGIKRVKSGTLVGKTYAETAYSPAVVGDEQVYFVWLDVDLSKTNDVELYMSGQVYYNFLPVALSAPLLAKLSSRFTFTEGA